MPSPSPRGDFLRATIDMAVLGLLAKKPLHGFAITQAILGADESFAGFHPGTVYPVLRRLEAEGFIKGVWGVGGERGRRIRVYEITSSGRRELGSRRSTWERMARALARLVGPKRVQIPG